jgi:hypothetical protein
MPCDTKFVLRVNRPIRITDITNLSHWPQVSSAAHGLEPDPDEPHRGRRVHPLQLLSGVDAAQAFLRGSQRPLPAFSLQAAEGHCKHHPWPLVNFTPRGELGLLSSMYGECSPLCSSQGVNTLYCLEEWRGKYIIKPQGITSPPGDKINPWWTTSPLGSRFAPMAEVKNGPLQCEY